MLGSKYCFVVGGSSLVGLKSDGPFVAEKLNEGFSRGALAPTWSMEFQRALR